MHKYKMTTSESGEIVVSKNGIVIAQMIDLRSIGMGIAPHWISSDYSELDIIRIINILAVK